MFSLGSRFDLLFWLCVQLAAFLFIVCVFLVVCSSGAEAVTVDVHQARALIQAGHVYVDVRTAEEFEKGHPDADKILNIPYMLNTPRGMLQNPEFLNKVSSACNKEDHLLVGCKSGGRSVKATADLMAHGYKNVRNLGGGYGEWLQNQLPVKASVPGHIRWAAKF